MNTSSSSKIIIAFDSFKDCLSSLELGNCVNESLKKENENICTEVLEISDGGEGLLNCLASSLKGIEIIQMKNSDMIIGPLGKPLIDNQLPKYAINRDERYAIIEMAQASGLPLVPMDKRNPANTTAYGTGQLIKHAIDINGCNCIYIGAGGSATIEAGLSALQALNVIKFQGLHENDDDSSMVFGRNLNDITGITVNQDTLNNKYKHIKFNFLTDVDCPMIGSNGAVYRFAHQKGATSDNEKETLERGMINISKLFENNEIQYIKGTGAAGGLASSFIFAFGMENIKILKGIEFVCDTFKLVRRCIDGQVSMIVSGEGQFDSTTLEGKAISKLIQCSLDYDIPLIIICGQNKLSSATTNPFPSSSKIQIHSLVENFGLDQSLNNTLECIDKLFQTNQNLINFLKTNQIYK